MIFKILFILFIFLSSILFFLISSYYHIFKECQVLKNLIKSYYYQLFCFFFSFQNFFKFFFNFQTFLKKSKKQKTIFQDKPEKLKTLHFENLLNLTLPTTFQSFSFYYYLFIISFLFLKSFLLKKKNAFFFAKNLTKKTF